MTAMTRFIEYFLYYLFLFRQPEQNPFYLPA